jgi:hypothetical protein
MTLYKAKSKTPYQKTIASLSLTTKFYRGLLLFGIFVSLFIFPLDILKQVRLGDTIILFITAYCGLKIYGNKQLKNGYTKGYQEAVRLRENY